MNRSMLIQNLKDTTSKDSYWSKPAHLFEIKPLYGFHNQYPRKILILNATKPQLEEIEVLLFSGSMGYGYDLEDSPLNLLSDIERKPEILFKDERVHPYENWRFRMLRADKKSDIDFNSSPEKLWNTLTSSEWRIIINTNLSPNYPDQLDFFVRHDIIPRAYYPGHSIAGVKHSDVLSQITSSVKFIKQHCDRSMDKLQLYVTENSNFKKRISISGEEVLNNSIEAISKKIHKSFLEIYPD